MHVRQHLPDSLHQAGDSASISATRAIRSSPAPQKLIDSGGRVQRFANKFGTATETVAAREAAKKAERAAAVEAMLRPRRRQSARLRLLPRLQRAAEFAKKAEAEAAKAAAEAEAAAVVAEGEAEEAAEEAVAAEVAENAAE